MDGCRAGTVELIGSPHPSSRTRALAGAVHAALASAGVAAHDNHAVLELSEIVGFTFTAQPVAASTPHIDPFAVLCQARLLIVASPVYKGTYTGLLKLFLDQLPRNALAGAIAIPVVVAASPLHQQPASEALTALLRELGAAVPVAPVTAAASTSSRSTVAAWANQYATAIDDALTRHNGGCMMASEPATAERRADATACI
jgi:FMN reductase